MSVNYTEAASKSVDVGGVPFVYRELGPAAGVPLLFLNHITAVLDDWDPAVVDGFAAERHVVLVDLRGVGGSGGTTPDDIEAMAADAVAFVEALGLGTVDLLGFSLGGMVAQEFMRQRPDLARRVILAATSPAGDEGVADWGAKLQAAFAKADADGKHPKHSLFFSPTAASQAAAEAFLARLDRRGENRDTPVSQETIGAQLAAAARWERESASSRLPKLTIPVFVVNGDEDVMVPTVNSFHLAGLLPDAKLAVYPDSGHGAIFQYHALFVEQSLEFLRD